MPSRKRRRLAVLGTPSDALRHLKSQQTTGAFYSPAKAHTMCIRRYLTSLILLLLALNASAQVYVFEPEPKLLTPLLEKLSDYIDTKGPLTVSIKPCGQVNAYWDNVAEITICQEYRDELLRRQQETIEKTAGRVDPKNIALASSGEMAFVLFHELAHALIDRHQIAFTGREEDAADQFAAYMLMEANNPTLYVGATNFFAEPTHMFKVFGRRQLTDEHALNIQRRAQLICWGYGRDPRLMQRIAEHSAIAPSRLQRCAEEYSQMMRNTPRVFAVAIRKPIAAAPAQSTFRP